MTEGQTPSNHLCKMNRNDKPVPVMPDVEYNETVDIVRIGETSS